MLIATIKPETEEIIKQGWIKASWEEFIELSTRPEYAKCKFYYYQGRYYLEMGVGANHALVNTIVTLLVNLFCMYKVIPVKGYINCSYRKIGVGECQPDLSYYIGDRSVNAPNTGSIVDLEQNIPPDLVIEVADSSIDQDLGMKRMLYEEMSIKEYWVVDVNNCRITAFAMLEEMGSKRITKSDVLQGLDLQLLERALQNSQTMDNSQVGSWFMEQITRE